MVESSYFYYILLTGTLSALCSWHMSASVREYTSWARTERARLLSEFLQHGREMRWSLVAEDIRKQSTLANLSAWGRMQNEDCTLLSCTPSSNTTTVHVECARVWCIRRKSWLPFAPHCCLFMFLPLFSTYRDLSPLHGLCRRLSKHSAIHFPFAENSRQRGARQSEGGERVLSPPLFLAYTRFAALRSFIIL